MKEKGSDWLNIRHPQKRKSGGLHRTEGGRTGSFLEHRGDGLCERKGANAIQHNRKKNAILYGNL